jgi:CheY-like chemotaxis protein/HPt (histidine-containing phosphotransfer) domain-containing protein
MRILVAEDSHGNLILIQAYLKDPSFDVHTAPNGAMALEKFQADKYDLVLMDVEMPAMDGYTATRNMRAWEAEHQKSPTPILALTAHDCTEEEEKSLAAGCNAHLIKPIRKSDLLAAIRKYACRQNSAQPAVPMEKIRVRPTNGIEDAVPLFLNMTRRDLRSLSGALRQKDYAKIRFIGHDLKGSGGGYGFNEISVIGDSIEEAARRSDGDEIRRQISALADYLDRVEVVYD